MADREWIIKLGKLIEEKFDQLQAENARLKADFDILSGLVIMDYPELWENYLQALHGKGK